jgi:hypothetical protein
VRKSAIVASTTEKGLVGDAGRFRVWAEAQEMLTAATIASTSRFVIVLLMICYF